MITNPYDLSNADCVHAIEALDNGDFELTDWEAEFVGNNLTRNYFSEKQKEVISRLIDKYDVRFKSP